MNDDQDRLLHDVLLEGEANRKEDLRLHCLRELTLTGEKERIRQVALDDIRTQRRRRQFSQVALAAAAILVFASLVYVVPRPTTPSSNIPIVEAHPAHSPTATNPDDAPKPTVKVTCTVHAIALAERSVPKIETMSASTPIPVASNRYQRNRGIVIAQARRPLLRITKLSRFAMTRYIGSYAKIDTNAETGLAFNNPEVRRAFFEKGIPALTVNRGLNPVPITR